MLCLLSNTGFCQTRSLLMKQADDLDVILKVSQEQVEALRLKAQIYYVIPDTKHSFWFRYITNNESEKIFSLDNAPIDLRHCTGNLTGIGSIKKRTREFYRDIDMALELYPQFIITKSLVPNAQWVYFTSVNRFLNVYPWVPSSENHFTESILEQKFFTWGTPKENPKKAPFWTPIYVDEAGMGLMVTLASPVYDGKEFKGTVALDLTLSELHDMLRKSALPTSKTLVLLINEENQILANPSLKYPINEILYLKDVLPDDLREEQGFLDGYPEDKIYEINGYSIRYKYLKSAPWRLVFIKK